MLDFSQQLAWLVTMARQPGAKAYAWQRAKDLELLFPGMATALKDAMTGQEKTWESVDQTLTKPP